ncbi:PREDICTED: probable ubiquitin carboxyl-terminal hydrolase FAM188B [Amphimedon queenslandica]|uniref:Ubiquitin carboxyl-terminal hydrolase MINDY n=1 Tax=Amphimedon queenslandica TaxID=400682 RepID=A0A1X7VL31_AMPQE|nr:PREDICTED: probable ubiquitin carboxyl-terminal hydrolase FAM188B [Amphimedon queenslandica]|eukprot:XP_019864184.1 PREDICTED: probable ubiquitin carboxyl-terminal hydrolase FAM188B [Amphimedon queenslandica]
MASSSVHSGKVDPAILRTSDGGRKKKVEDVSIALVREYLSRKGYKSTLSALDTEVPRTEESISNRSVLVKEAGVVNIMKSNKKQPDPYRTIIEAIVNNQLETTPTTLTTPTNPTTPITPTTSVRTPPTPTSTTPITTLTTPITGPSRTINKTNGKPVTYSTTPTITTSARITTPTSTSTLDSTKKVTRYQSEDDSSKSIGTKITNDGGLLLYEDIEEDSSFLLDDKVVSHLFSSSRNSKGEQISYNTAIKLREVVFGSATTHSFNSEWRNQGFVFNKEVPSLSYGLVQHKGGPCGVLACVQSYIIKNMLFADGANSADGSTDAIPFINRKEQKELLCKSLAQILWKAGERKKATVTVRSWSPPVKSLTVRSRSYYPDQLTELLVVHSFLDFDQLQLFLLEYVDQFISAEEENAGCILFLYSVILSRGVERLKTDFDDANNTKLLGAHGYCSQELVNLFLTGAGTSNTFNGDIVIDEGTRDSQRLKGLYAQSEIGYLTLFEYYGSCKVGEFYKSPVYPIWVVCSESHFTVIFSLNKDIVDKNSCFSIIEFNIHYYDGLGQFMEPVILNLNLSQSVTMISLNLELMPPLELTLHTKWKGQINWSCDKIY